MSPWCGCVTPWMPRLMSSLRLESASLPPAVSPCLYSNRIESYSFSQRKRAWEDLGKPHTRSKWWRSPTRTNRGQSTCRSLICARGPSGWCVALTILNGSCLESLGRTHEQQERWLLLLAWRWIWSGRDARCLLAGSSPLRAVITADCVSQRLALIGLSLSVCWRKEELAFVMLPWRRGHLMRASMLWLMTSLSLSDILQMDNLLHHSQFCTTVNNHKGHTSAAKPRRMDGRSIEDKWTVLFMLKLSLLIHLQGSRFI